MACIPHQSLPYAFPLRLPHALHLQIQMMLHVQSKGDRNFAEPPDIYTCVQCSCCEIECGVGCEALLQLLVISQLEDQHYPLGVSIVLLDAGRDPEKELSLSASRILKSHKPS